MREGPNGLSQLDSMAKVSFYSEFIWSDHLVRGNKFVIEEETFTFQNCQQYAVVFTPGDLKTGRKDIVPYHISLSFTALGREDRPFKRF
jgi:hypothetical protein